MYITEKLIYQGLIPTQVFSCEYHKKFDKIFFYGTPEVAVSENGLRFSKNF